ACLDPENFKEFKLVKRTELSHNVAKGKDGVGEDVVKPYTPTTLDSDVGFFDLVIKMYPQGRMSHHFRELREGDYLSVKGPKGRFKYQPNQVRAFGMLAGGTGITPMFQVTRAILENPKDKTNVNLIYANVAYDDILLKVTVTLHLSLNCAVFSFCRIDELFDVFLKDNTFFGTVRRI
ncbi:NADH--cytochrome b5 reductase 1, partial [Linum perenne]